MAKKDREKKNFGLINEKGQEIGVYTGSQARDAALKAANRGIDKIVLREKGTKKLHYFVGKRELVAVPKNAPAWILEAARNNKDRVYKACVAKIGTANLKDTRLENNPKSLFKIPIKSQDKQSNARCDLIMDDSELPGSEHTVPDVPDIKPKHNRK